MGWRGKPYSVKCPIGKGYALCVKAMRRILVEENVLEEAGIAAGC